MNIDDASRVIFRRGLVRDESLKLKPYLDHKGNWTYGVGRLIGKSICDLTISKATALQMLEEDIDEALAIAVKIFGVNVCESWSPARLFAITTLIFTMGEGDSLHGFRSFHNTIDAIVKQDWQRAADNVAESKWAADVDPKKVPGKGRDDRVVEMLRTGEYNGEYLKDGAI